MSIMCFVGHVFDKEQIDNLRAAIKEGFGAAGATTGIEFWYADDHISSTFALLDACFDLSINKNEPPCRCVG